MSENSELGVILEHREHLQGLVDALNAQIARIDARLAAEFWFREGAPPTAEDVARMAAARARGQMPKRRISPR